MRLSKSISFLTLLCLLVTQGLYGKSVEEQSGSEKKTGDLKSLLALDKGKQDEPVSIRSENASFDNKGLMGRYIGNVVVIKGDMTLTADEVKSFFDKKSKKVKRIEAFGHVRVEKAGRVITAEKAVFFDDVKKIELTGSPRMVQGENLLEGDKISFFINQDKLMIHGNVRTVFLPKKAPDDIKKNKAKKTGNKKVKANNEASLIPTHVSSNELVFLKNDDKAYYKGNVEVNRGDVKLFADNIYIEFDRRRKALLYIIAKNMVKLVEKDGEITAGMGEYNVLEEKIVFSGTPITKTANSSLRGSRIVCYLSEGRVTVSSATSVLYPDELKKLKRPI